MKKLLRYLTLILITFSCSKDDVSEYDKVNSDIKVVIAEELSDSKGMLNIASETIERQPCINFSLISKHDLEGNKIKIKYSGIYRPEICPTAIGPARANHSFDLLNGNYDIELINDNISNSISLMVDSEKYIIKSLLVRNIVLEMDTLYRVPAYTYWGTIGYHQESSERLVNDFIDTLKIMGANFKSFKNGNYGYFTIVDNEIQAPMNHGYHFAKAIIFEIDENNEQILKDGILNFAEIYRNDLSISITSFRGERINIWN